ncbi:MAG: iron-sulfur cluster repair di-iron protein [Planctomycetota bacterium]
MTSRAWCLLLAVFLGLIHTSGASFAEEPPREAWTGSSTVGEVVARRPATARIFELVGIDYCCGGETTLTAAAEAAGVDPVRLLAALAVVGQGASSTAESDWTRKSSREIVKHILDTHHAFLRRELPRIAHMAARAARVHGEQHPEIREIDTAFQALSRELMDHLALEEEHVFPALLRLGEGVRADDATAARLATLDQDHARAGEVLHKLRKLAADYVAPEWACPLVRELFRALQAFEQDMHRHVHLENSVLLPRHLPR